MADPVYDPEQGDNSPPPGIGQPSDMAPDFVAPKTYPSDGDAAAGELGGKDTPQTNSATQAEQAALGDESPDDQLNYTGGKEKPGSQKKGLRGAARRLIGRIPVRRRAAIAGVAASVIMGGSVIGFMGSPLLTALHIGHYGELLQATSKQNTLHKSTQASKLYRYLRLKDAGNTRLGLIQTAAAPKLIERLTKDGYRLVPSTSTGQIRALIIDTSKTSEFAGKSMEEAKAELSKRLGVPESKIGGNYTTTYTGRKPIVENGKTVGYERTSVSTGFINIALNDLSVPAQEAVIRDTAVLNRTGKRAAFIPMRLLRGYYNVPSIFQPFERMGAIADQKFASWVERNEFLKKIREKRRAKIIARQKAATAAWKKMKDSVNSVSGKVGGAILVQGALCGMRDNADIINNIQRDLMVIPGMLSAAQAMAMDDQLKADTNVSVLALESAVQGMYNSNGFSVFDGKAASILEGRTGYPKQDTTGQYEQDYQMIVDAHSGNTQLGKLVNILDKQVGAEVICSPAGQLTGAAGGLLLLATGTGGFMTKGILYGVEMGMTYAVSKATLGAIEYFVTRAAMEITDGPLDGDNTIYGKVSLDNATALNAGGSILTRAQSASLANDLAIEKRKEQSQKSLVARIFNLEDRTSVAGRFVDDISPNLSRNASVAVSNFLNVGKTAVTTPLTLLTSTASAEDNQLAAQKLGMPVIAQQPAILAINDPYENADKAAAILDADAATYQKKAKICYGVDLTKATDATTGKTYWDVSYVEVPSISTLDYEDAKCNEVTSSVSTTYPSTTTVAVKNDKSGFAGIVQDIGNLIKKPFTEKAYAEPVKTNYTLNKWGVVTGLISYDNTMEAMACTEAEIDEACAKLGMGSTAAIGTGSGTATGTGTAPTTIDTTALYQDSTAIACDSRTVPLGQQEVTWLRNEAGKQTFKINICGIKEIPSHGKESTPGNGYYVAGANGMSIVNSRVSKAYADLAAAAKAANVKLSSGSTFRKMAHQNDLYIANGKDSSLAAPPGKSRHEIGLAIDFSTGGSYKKGAPCSARSTARSSAMWNFLNGKPGAPGAQQFGLYQYAAEAWHWDADPSRCKEPA